MFSYTVSQWLFFFYFYCFIGWCFESSYVSLKEKRWINRGFLKGPFLPIYGSGAIMMLVASAPFTDHWWAVYIAGSIGATALEFVTGAVMEALFKVRYWDYSYKRFHIHGYICLSSTLAWGGCTLLMTYVLHKPVESFVFGIPSGILSVLVLVLTVVLAGDFGISFRAALDLKDILVRMEGVKEELIRLEKRLAALLPTAEEERHTQQRIAELRAAIEKKLSLLKEHLKNKETGYSEETGEELIAMHTAYGIQAERLKDHKGLQKRIRNNPSMHSRRFGEVLEELKERGRNVE